MSQHVSYTSRDFNSIKADLINAISSLTDIWTSREQSDPGMVLVTLMAALGDMLSFNMDKQSLEFFGKTVTQRKNAQYIFDLVGYKMHWYESAQLKINVLNFNSDSALNLSFNPSSSINNQRLTSTLVKSAPEYFILNPNETPDNWNQNTIISIPPNTSQEFIAVQGSLSSISFTSSSIDSNNRYYLPVTKIDQNHMWLKDDSGSYNWYKVENLHELSDSLPRFEFGVDEYNMPYIEFVPYWKSAFGGKDNTVLKFTLYYLATYGSAGSVTANILNYISNIKATNQSYSNIDVNTSIDVSHGTNAYITDEPYNLPGKDIETPTEAYYNTKNIIGTYNTLVTVVDFEKFYRRMGFTNAIVIDGQRAEDLNSKLDNIENYVTSFEDNSSVIYVDELPKRDNIDDFMNLHNLSLDENNRLTCVLSLSVADGTNDAGLYELNVEEENDGESPIKRITVLSSDYDRYGLKPYTANAYLVWHDFRETDPMDSSYRYASSHEVSVKDKNGYINYMLEDKLIGNSSDSYINSKTVDDLTLANCKLISADIIYMPVRKFPFFIDGQIHLREPMSPINANLILQKVYYKLRNAFSADKLTFGRKIKFADIIRVITSADENIDYFDAGANNTSGSLVVYPKAGDINPLVTNNITGYERFNINIDPIYFNPISLQHYEDMMFSNSKYIYWCSTSSGGLSIAPDSIKDKTKPYIDQDIVRISEIVVDGRVEGYKLVINVNDNLLLDDELSPLFEYAFVQEAELLANGDYIVISQSNWTDNSEFKNLDSTTSIKKYNDLSKTDYTEISNTYLFAARMKPTISTAYSNEIYVGIHNESN